jgi:hypothetical protein
VLEVPDQVAVEAGVRVDDEVNKHQVEESESRRSALLGAEVWWIRKRQPAYNGGWSIRTTP